MSTFCYHTCGHQLWQDSHFSGLAHTAIFIDDEASSPTCGQEVDNCPGCGELIALENVSGDDLVDEDAISTTQDMIILRKIKLIAETDYGLGGEELIQALDVICRVLDFSPDQANYVIGDTDSFPETETLQ